MEDSWLACERHSHGLNRTSMSNGIAKFKRYLRLQLHDGPAMAANAKLYRPPPSADCTIFDLRWPVRHNRQHGHRRDAISGRCRRADAL